ncbi:MAG TPA: ABC transporter ATP-binding protein [Blastocatellia bacterium]|jgi:spermidine/putrescine transport system ATP-binding protein
MTDSYEVEIQDVTRRFGDLTAVESISLQVGRGEFLTLLGPSGCGKTTLLRMIAGFETPDKGRVLLGGNDVTDLPPFRRDVTTVFQQYALFPHLNVFDNVSFGLERRRTPPSEIKRRVADALDLVRLAGLDDRRIDELSGGQQQRVALARSLVLEPRVLLLDEPLAALDFKLRKQMQVELKNLQRRLGISFIYVTHDQEEALTMSDRIVVMNAGRVEQVGSAEEVYERPATEFVAGFIGISNIIEGVVESTIEDRTIIKIGKARMGAFGSGASAGRRARVLVRPEKIILSDTETEDCIVGRIESAIYLGDSTQLRVSIDGAQQITIVEQNRNRSASSRKREGDVVWLGWEPENALLFQ